MKKLLILFLLLAATAHAQGNVKATATVHSVTLTWTASKTTGVTYNVYRAGALLGNVKVLTYVDSTVAAGSTYTYYISSLCVSCPTGITGESTKSSVTATTPPDLPPPVFAVGARVQTSNVANVRATAPTSGYGTLLGTVPAASAGTVTSGAQVPSTLGWTWIQVKFDTCPSTIPGCTGYVGSDNLILVTAPPPLTLTCAANVCTVGGGVSGQTGSIQIIPGGPTATWKKP